MDKNAIKKYAVWAREELIEKVTAKAVENAIVDGQEMDEQLESINGIVLSETRKKQRASLIKKIKEAGYDQVMEEVAYTWFNRFIAIRFMEVNGYLPSHVRVFSDENGNFNPQIMAEAIHLDIDGLDMDHVLELKTASKDDELFKYLLKVQCNALNAILPKMFSKLEDYTELLLPDYLLREGSVIEKLVNDIPEDNFDVNTDNGQIEIIGWMYQYYISAKHEEVVDPLHGKVVKKEEVPAATQLFTTDWVVRYLIDNSVGRYWIERNPESQLAKELTYFVRTKDGQIKYVDEKIAPQDVTVFDPCVGSGHFLVYAFEVLMKIYVEYGFSERDAASEIVKNNIYGLDIDGRATQLAYFAVMMKARQYDRRFFTRGIQPQIYEITESNNTDKASKEYFCGNDAALKKDIDSLLEVLKDAKEYGSILQMPKVDFEKINERFEQVAEEISMYNTYLLGEFKSIIRPAFIMSKKYAVVATNPPYLNKYDSKLKDFINAKYKDYSGDLFSVFIYRNFDFCNNGGYTGFMTPFVWMFIQAYEKTRNYIVKNKTITTLIQMEYSAYEEATVPICSFVLKNNNMNEESLCFRLSDFKGGMSVQNIKVLEAINNPTCGYFYEINQHGLLNIPGTPIAYWISDKMMEAFKHEYISDFAISNGQNITGNNNKFLRLFWEVDFNNINNNYWAKCARGGGYRKYFGNDDNVILWTDTAKEHYHKDKIARIVPEQLQFKEGITWSYITSGNLSFRKLWSYELFEKAGTSIFVKDESHLLPILGLLNSSVGKEILRMISPTINCQVRDVFSVPVLPEIFVNQDIAMLVQQNIDITRADWDSFETSWDYSYHPFLDMKKDFEKNGTKITRLAECYELWKNVTLERFNRLKQNEQKLNMIFVDIYGLNGEVKTDVEDNDISVRLSEIEREVRSFISYSVGCMFGRYSLDTLGLAYAGGDWDASKYTTFKPDEDAIIPICDDEYFEDDIVGRFIQFVEVVYGKDTLEENLQFIADAIGGTSSSREIIRNYFINDFYTDHIKTYQKRPIYWLFDSGKKNGFKCLVYMHRYQSDTIARIRTDYVHEQQARYRTAIEETANRIEAASGSEKVKLTKKLNALKAQDEEIHEYEEKVHHLADQMISIDLDDGVKKNYEIFKDVLAKIK